MATKQSVWELVASYKDKLVHVGAEKGEFCFSEDALSIIMQAFATADENTQYHENVRLRENEHNLNSKIDDLCRTIDALNAEICSLSGHLELAQKQLQEQNYLKAKYIYKGYRQAIKDTHTNWGELEVKESCT